jgi:hypothetical protein
MTAYASDHAGAYADVASAGSAVTFTKSVQGAQDPATGLFTDPTTVTVAGVALRVKGDPQRYRDLGLTESAAPTLLFVPATYGETPPLGATGVFGGETYTVRDVNPLAPDGTAVLAKVVVVR